MQYDRYGNASSCELPCLGDASKICGGPFALSVYNTGEEIVVELLFSFGSKIPQHYLSLTQLFLTISVTDKVLFLREGFLQS